MLPSQWTSLQRGLLDLTADRRQAELGQLPASLLQVPLALLQIAEATGRWPLQATTVSVTLLLKPGPPTALNMRPISVTPVLYRAWGAARWPSMVKWQRTWSHDEQYGFHPGRAASDASGYTALAASLTTEADCRMVLLDLDLAKAFDRIPRDFGLQLLEHMGVPLHGPRAAGMVRGCHLSV